MQTANRARELRRSRQTLPRQAAWNSVLTWGCDSRPATATARSCVGSIEARAIALRAASMLMVMYLRPAPAPPFVNQRSLRPPAPRAVLLALLMR